MKKFIAALLLLAGCTMPAPTSNPVTLVPPPMTIQPTTTLILPTYTVTTYTVTPVLPKSTPTADVPLGVIFAGPYCKDYFVDNTDETATINMSECFAYGRWYQYAWGIAKA